MLILNVSGAIRNTEPLDYERSHNHILSVVAYDCGMKQSVPVMVTVKVNRICKLGWKGNTLIAVLQVLSFRIHYLLNRRHFFVNFKNLNVKLFELVLTKVKKKKYLKFN